VNIICRQRLLVCWDVPVSKVEELHYQVFIEPKGNQFKDASGGYENSSEGWKENFLKEITEKHGQDKLLIAESENYKLIGLPLYNKVLEKRFRERVQESLKVSL